MSMRRSQSETGPGLPQPQRTQRLRGAIRSHNNLSGENQDAAIMRSIASFLTFSDVLSFASDFPLDVDHNIGHPHSNGVGHSNGHGHEGQGLSQVELVTPAGSWAVGVELQDSSGFWSASIATPITPALVAVSPGATPHEHQHQLQHPDHDSEYWRHQQQQQQPREHQIPLGTDDEDEEDAEYMQELLRGRRRQWAQEKLAAAVFSHPRSLRSFCWEAYMAAKEIREQQRQLAAGDESDPETLREPPSSSFTTSGTRKRRRTEKGKHIQLLHELIDLIFHNAPLSVLLDVIEVVTETSLDTTVASFKISLRSMNAILQALGRLVRTVWDGVSNFNPFALLEAIISLQFNAMGKTSGVLVSGIQSVATGVGSASSLALHRLSAANPAAHRHPSSSSLLPGNDGSRSRRRSTNTVLNKKLLRKLSTINAAARVVSYTEIQDDTGGLNQYARSRVQRMLHYDVSLRPFVATISVRDGSIDDLNNNNDYDEDNNATTRPDSATPQIPQAQEDMTDVLSEAEDDDGNVHVHASPNLVAATVPQAVVGPNSPAWVESSPSSGSPIGSSFMCTPQSFPPTPHSRSMVIARGNRFSDDVVFLARDRLRVHGGLESENERTREMARLLREGKSLAVFDAKDAAASGIELTCGQHIAAKVGNMMYCGTRSMVPVLRNCWVYFEMLVIPRPVGNVVLQASVATLSIGLSTGEMPPNTLVGAWQGSVGLCSTGQILMAGQWCTPLDSFMSAYTDSATVGCLVCLDDDSAFETWDGVMVTAGITFSVNGVVVSPPVSQLSVTGRPGTLPSASSVQMGLMGARLGDESMGSSNRIVGPGLPSATLPLLVPAAEDLYPTVTLHSPTSAVMCRFSAEDVNALSRESIGAPPGVTVYAVDGSVIEFEAFEASPDLSTARVFES